MAHAAVLGGTCVDQDQHHGKSFKEGLSNARLGLFAARPFDIVARMLLELVHDEKMRDVTSSCARACVLAVALCCDDDETKTAVAKSGLLFSNTHTEPIPVSSYLT